MVKKRFLKKNKTIIIMTEKSYKVFFVVLFAIYVVLGVIILRLI